MVTGVARGVALVPLLVALTSCSNADGSTVARRSQAPPTARSTSPAPVPGNVVLHLKDSGRSITVTVGTTVDVWLQGGVVSVWPDLGTAVVISVDRLRFDAESGEIVCKFRAVGPGWAHLEETARTLCPSCRAFSATIRVVSPKGD